MRKFEEIRTDRLHVAIAGAVLGKSVKFHPNNYFKCRAVFEYSMAHRFSTVEWVPG
jgi:exopolysaccharide biosynthesis predicted pyruvyltransferase EpsI